MTKKTICFKLENNGQSYLFVGYTKDHAGDVYRMLNPKTGGVTKTNNVCWLNKMYGEVYDKDNIDNFLMIEDHDDSEDNTGTSKKNGTMPAGKSMEEDFEKSEDRKSTR